jgi:AmmeMemoRadiSam system protein B/AmmeMemoRadiSam system protein A
VNTKLLRFVLLAVVCVAMPFTACSQEEGTQKGGAADMEGKTIVREPAVAGSFYPGTEQALRETVADLLRRAEPPPVEGKVVGLISPHAGYVYSGQVAAHAYRLVEGKTYDDVIIVAPSHHVYFKGSSIYNQGPYRTPLGDIETDREVAKAMMDADDSIVFNPQAHLTEHSLEVQLPFLQMTVRNLKIVPIVMGDQSMENCKRLAAAIVKCVKGKNVLLVASSDLSHFHPYDEAVRLDQVVIDDVLAYDYEQLARDLDVRRCEACGGGPIITVMMAAKELGASKAVKLAYANSGDVTGDKSGVVGYFAGALVEESSVGVDLGLNEEDKADLLKLARSTIEAKLRGKPIPDPRRESARLNEERGAFVTLTEHGQLRGCIGHIRGTQPLCLTVSEMAIAAATEDPRFPAMTAGELGDVSIEISVLTPLRTITDPEEIEVGRDGIYIQKGFNSGLLLPQVATDYGWDRYEFLDHTCMKAGLPAGCWREGATIQIFSAQIFGEEGHTQ